MKRVVVIGAGRWATIMHKPALLFAQTENLLLVSGVCDLNANACADFAKAFPKASCYQDADKMIAELKPDGVILLVGPNVLPSLILKAASKWNLPFLCEKPPAPNLEVHNQLISSVGSLPHLIGYNRRFAPYVQKAKSWLKEAELSLVHGMFTRHRRLDEEYSTTFVHGIDTLLYLMSDKLAELNVAIDYHKDFYNMYLHGFSQKNICFQYNFMPNVGSSLEHYKIKGIDVCVDIAFAQNDLIDLPGFVEKHKDNKIAEHCSHYDLGMKANDVFHIGGYVDEYRQFAELLKGNQSIDSTLEKTKLTQLIRDRVFVGISSGQKKFSIDLS